MTKSNIDSMFNTGVCHNNNPEPSETNQTMATTAHDTITTTNSLTLGCATDESTVRAGKRRSAMDNQQAPSMPAAKDSSEATVTTESKQTSLFAKLPGELRNRIYYIYFQDFEAEREHVTSLKRIASKFLNLLHSDHMIRTEAGSIFYRASLPLLCSSVTLDGGSYFESAKQFLVDLCGLVKLHDVHMQVSLRLNSTMSLRNAMVGLNIARFVAREKNEPWKETLHQSAKSVSRFGTVSSGSDWTITFSESSTSRLHVLIEGALVSVDWRKMTYTFGRLTLLEKQLYARRGRQ